MNDLNDGSIRVLRLEVGAQINPDGGVVFGAALLVPSPTPPAAALVPALTTAIQALNEELIRLRPQLPAGFLADVDQMTTVRDEPA